LKILLIDNNDSFTRNLEHLLAASAPGSTVLVRSHADIGFVDLETPDLIVISPGPGTPADYAGYDRVFATGKPVLGICLGMQIINEHRGGATGRLPGCVHGKTDAVTLGGVRHVVARYHSLHVTRTGAGLDMIAANDEGIPMCLGDRTARIIGYQFHPESFLTQDGGALIGYALDFLGLR